MNFEKRITQHLASAEREEAAALRAVTPASANIHHALAQMYRHEAAKSGAVKAALRLAFGD